MEKQSFSLQYAKFAKYFMYFFKWFKRRLFFIYTLFPNSSNAEFSKGERIEAIFCSKKCGVTWCETHFNSLFHHHHSYILLVCVCASILTLKFCNNSCCIKILLTLKFEIHPEYFDSTMHGEGKTFNVSFAAPEHGSRQVALVKYLFTWS